MVNFKSLVKQKRAVEVSKLLELFNSLRSIPKVKWGLVADDRLHLYLNIR
jgi:hypothetical protein